MLIVLTFLQIPREGTPSLPMSPRFSMSFHPVSGELWSLRNGGARKNIVDALQTPGITSNLSFCGTRLLHLASIPSPILGQAQESGFLHPISRPARASDVGGHFLFFLMACHIDCTFLMHKTLSVPRRPDQTTSLRAHRDLGEGVEYSFSTGDREMCLLIPWIFPPGPVKNLF